LGSRLAKTARRVPTLVFAARATEAPGMELAKLGVQVVAVGDLREALQVLCRRGVQSLLIEGGAGLGGAMLAAGVVDRLIIFHSPVLLGAGALPAFGGEAAIERLRVVERREFGDDLMTVYAVHELPATF
jgi:diaminohydroxyphosphoribosylaminopyrimidine deaminase/5-amino-6-(5-phosphoribosylamino)uracil reductase